MATILVDYPAHDQLMEVVRLLREYMSANVDSGFRFGVRLQGTHYSKETGISTYCICAVRELVWTAIGEQQSDFR